MIAYLDTNAVIWLAEGSLDRMTKRSLDAVNAHDLFVSPFVSFELTLLFQIGRILRPSQVILRQLRSQLDVQICDFPLPQITLVANDETWTREPMDRFIVAHARANNYSPLISSDAKIAVNYPPTIW